MNDSCGTSLRPPAVSPSLARFNTLYAESRRIKARVNLANCLVALVLLLACAYVGDFDPVTIIRGIPRLHEYVVKTIPTLRWDFILHDLGEWFLLLDVWLDLLLETVLIAFVATSLAVFSAFSLGLCASSNLRPTVWLYFLARRILEVARTVPDLVYALIFVFCFGVGPLAGVLAIAVHATGSLGKLFSEVNENIDPKPLEGLRAAGASWLQTVRYAVVPQVMPDYLSYSLLRFEINVRSSSVVGYVGAGGLGHEIRTAVGFGEYHDLSAIFVIIFCTVVIIDLVCEKLRHFIIGRERLEA